MEIAYSHMHYKDLESAKQNFFTASQAVDFELEWGGKNFTTFSQYRANANF